MDKLRQAATMALEALHAELEAGTCEEFESAAEKCYEAITALREALTDLDWEAIDKEQLRRYKEKFGDFEQAEQKPVAWVDLEQWQSGEYDCFTSEKVADYMTPLYAAPVRTEDLTDDEIERALDAANVTELPDGYKNVDIEIARAVIAADRKLNGVEK